MLSTMNLTSIIMPQGIKIVPGGYVSAAGDVNGDGRPDFFVNIYDATYLIWGKTTGWQDIDLNNLDSSLGIKFYCNNGIGSSIGVDDVNCDGIDDILISSPNGGTLSQGITYLIWGKDGTWQDINLDNFNSSYGITIIGANYGDSSGNFISKLGDINGDKCNDFFIATDESFGYIIFGKSAESNINLANLVPVQGITVQGIFNIDASTYPISGAGDVNKDGYDDILISTHPVSTNAHIAYLIFGRNGTWANINLDSLNISQGITIYNSYVYVSAAGDVNKDGYDDFLIDDKAKTTYLIWGRDTGWQNMNLTNFNHSHGVIIKGGSYFYYSGYPISSAGDVNKDGFDDILIGSAKTNQANKATIYLILGNITLQNINLVEFNCSQGVVIQDTTLIASMCNAQDINKDGYDDILIGSSYGQTSEASYLIFGGKIETPSPTIHPDHPTTPTTITPTLPTISTTDIPTAPTAPTMPTFPTTEKPTIDPTTIAPINGTSDADSESHSESWASSPTGIGILTTAAILAAGAIVLGTWYCLCYRNRIANNKLQEGLLDNELDILQ